MTQKKSIINNRKQYTIKAVDYLLELGKSTKIMGILNVTPDSFSHDGLLQPRQISAERKARKFIQEGADILDIGGESSRPGAKKITIKEELGRVIPIIRSFKKKFQIPISIDTYKPSVAKAALEEGACMVNYIKAAEPDIRILKAVRNHNAAIVLMHMQGIPRTMQKKVSYRNVVSEIVTSLQNSIKQCMEIGINPDKIIVDPGIGFGKTVEHNLEIINQLGLFQELNQPLLVGTSRKSFIGKIIKQDEKHRLNGTIASISASILKGAHIVRVHDVKATKEAALVTDSIINESYI